MIKITKSIIIFLSVFALLFLDIQINADDLWERESYTVYTMGGALLFFPKHGHPVLEKSERMTLAIKTVDLSEKPYKDLRGKK